MAEEEEISQVQEKKSPGIIKLLLMVLIVSLVMSAGVGAGVYFLLKSDDNTQAVEDESGEKAAEKPKGPPIYHEIQDPFIVNLAEQPARFLQVSVQLMTRDDDVIEAVEQHMPVIRNNLLILFSTQTLEEISTREGKEALRQDAIEEISTVLREQSEPSAVEDVFFTSLVVQ